MEMGQQKNYPRTDRIIAWFALIVSTTALVLVLLETKNRNEIYSTFDIEREVLLNEIKRSEILHDAESELNILINETVENTDFDAALVKVRNIRTRIKNAYNKASGEAKAEWQVLDAELDELETAFEIQTISFKEEIQDILNKL